MRLLGHPDPALRDSCGRRAGRLDSTQLGPIRIDHSEITARRERAEIMLERHSPAGVAVSAAERRRWTVEAMMAFATAEIRRTQNG